LLANAEDLASNAGVFAGSPASAEGWLARADCALTWLEELSLAVDALVGAVRADSHAISGLLERLACDNLVMRFVTAHAIEALGTDAAAAALALIERLHTEEDSSVALAVTGALVAIGPTATEPLMECLRTGTLRIARRAAITLCNISSAHCETVMGTLHKRLPANTTALTGDALLEAAELYGICGDTYAFIAKLPEAMHEYEASVAINSDVSTGRRQALAFVRWKLGVPPEGMIENSIGMRFAIIPNGEFMMGAPEEEPGMNAGEELLHRVRITRPFYIGACTVSQKEYSAVMDDNPSRFRDPALPVEHVSWRQATDFCKRLSHLAEEKRAGRVYRLPTEAEWEYACRAGTSTAFSCGDTLDHDVANFCDDSVITPQPTVPRGNFPPNAFGLHEMHGNVWEWCRDWYQVDYYEQSPCDNPPGPEDGHHHVMRGGSASIMVHECRAAMRGEAAGPPVDMPSDSAAQRFQRIGDFGFRVVCEIRVSDQ
jgi:formylglycine-generating enzyme required for sulfatase activity